MAERDYPVGHPAASDYKGEPYVDLFASYAFDFPEGHGARGGKNRGDLDTPDGVRESHLKQVTPLVDLATSGSLPPVFAPGRPEPLPLPPAQLAHIYAARLAGSVSDPLTTDQQQAIGYIAALGFNADEARKMFESYAQPAVAA